MKKLLLSAVIAASHVLNGYAQIEMITNDGKMTVAYSKQSGVTILTVDGLHFKDLNKNGKLDKYEDWRLDADTRAKDLAKKMTLQQIAGLMLYSAHQAIPAPEKGFGAGTYEGKPFSSSNAKADELTDQQKQFLKEDKLRHVLITTVQSPDVAARWNNNLQAFLEGIELGIPANNSSDPRHAATSMAEFDAGSGGQISLWPREIGLAATFDPNIVRQFGSIAAAEYRALGITTALSPQIDLATDPRWFRLGMTFGEDTKLVTDLARAYVDGFQTSTGIDEINDGWGWNSVNAMVKHWPGGGTGEAGRDAHWAYGKFAVYPNNNFDEHLKPFTDGAFQLEGKTKMAAAVMPYYTISHNQDPSGHNLGNGFSKFIIHDLLRTKYNYDGVVCTDWMITANEGKTVGDFAGKPWGTEKLSVAERHFLAIQAGVDQFGGNNEITPVLEAFKMGEKQFGKQKMRSRAEQSAVRLLKNIFRLGLFENPYLNPDESTNIVGNPQFMKAGYDAQLKSIVLLKNKNQILPIKNKPNVFVPPVYKPATQNWWGQWTTPTLENPVNQALLSKYFNVAHNPNDADFAVVFVSNPVSEQGGYSQLDRDNNGNGYIPISLQYRPYTATNARQQSIASGDPVTDPTVNNRSYLNKTSYTLNAADLDLIRKTRDMMQHKPVIAVVDVSNPMVFEEFENFTDAIIVRFGTSDQAVLDIITGLHEPSGLLPVQMPSNMQTVEAQYEDKAHDMNSYQDSEGNHYDFGFGLNWNGVINDHRTQKYKPH